MQCRDRIPPLLPGNANDRDLGLSSRLIGSTQESFQHDEHCMGFPCAIFTCAEVGANKALLHEQVASADTNTRTFFLPLQVSASGGCADGGATRLAWRCQSNMGQKSGNSTFIPLNRTWENLALSPQLMSHSCTQTCTHPLHAMHRHTQTQTQTHTHKP